MTLSLARDELRYDAEQLRALSEMVRVGDLTPVLRIYEEDIRTPLKSAVTGTLLRSVFIQVQKAKVDIDQTLAGIDKLLKSQELTFAFVGVAPALTIVYILGGAVIRFLGTGRQARYGGFKRRKEIWLDMRRIERLLISQPRSSSPLLLSPTPAGIPPLTAGLLMLSLTRLRSFAITALPARSLLQDRFLEDVQDLEDPGLGRAEKLRVVDRMWRCWGGLLGWGTAGDEGRL
jgi:nuclear control of ATPase protein 2